ncbi:hypothetical protein CYY_001900 [Polysphondylium violaceum]|uniref:Uncharacterized protein n=1 Tax=Polysphondylium violaceum TaxID=133409 RepID=A0A8J4Q0Y2_9MYCE|nr:hypothetical protein CYY_001900 [Polysphondylium violaceum]
MEEDIEEISSNNNQQPPSSNEDDDNNEEDDKQQQRLKGHKDNFKKSLDILYRAYQAIFHFIRDEKPSIVFHSPNSTRKNSNTYKYRMVYFDSNALPKQAENFVRHPNDPDAVISFTYRFELVHTKTLFKNSFVQFLLDMIKSRYKSYVLNDKRILKSPLNNLFSIDQFADTLYQSFMQYNPAQILNSNDCRIISTALCNHYERKEYKRHPTSYKVKSFKKKDIIEKILVSKGLDYIVEEDSKTQIHNLVNINSIKSNMLLSGDSISSYLEIPDKENAKQVLGWDNEDDRIGRPDIIPDIFLLDYLLAKLLSNVGTILTENTYTSTKNPFLIYSFQTTFDNRPFQIPTDSKSKLIVLPLSMKGHYSFALFSIDSENCIDIYHIDPHVGADCPLCRKKSFLFHFVKKNFFHVENIRYNHIYTQQQTEFEENTNINNNPNHNHNSIPDDDDEYNNSNNSNSNNNNNNNNNNHNSTSDNRGFFTILNIVAMVQDLNQQWIDNCNFNISQLFEFINNQRLALVEGQPNTLFNFKIVEINRLEFKHLLKLDYIDVIKKTKKILLTNQPIPTEIHESILRISRYLNQNFSTTESTSIVNNNYNLPFNSLLNLFNNQNQINSNNDNSNDNNNNEDDQENVNNQEQNQDDNMDSNNNIDNNDNNIDNNNNIDDDNNEKRKDLEINIDDNDSKGNLLKKQKTINQYVKSSPDM